MSEPKNTLDPEVIALLEEIAADPNSGLLRVPREPLQKWLAFREPPVSPREPLLTRAERHLVKVHREHVARLLLQACVMKLVDGPIAKTRIHRWVTIDQQLGLPTKAQWHSQVGRKLETKTPASDLTSSYKLLQLCGMGGSPPAASELGAASLRLAPSDDARIWIGVALHREGQSRSALHAFHDVLSHRPSHSNETWARIDCGLVHFDLGEYSDAVEWYRSAVLEAETPIPALNWFTSSLQIGDTKEAFVAVSYVDDIVAIDDPVLVEFTASLVSVSATPRSKQLVSSIQEQLSPVARSITDALPK